MSSSEYYTETNPCTNLRCQGGRDMGDGGTCHVCEGAGSLTVHREVDEERMMEEYRGPRGGEAAAEMRENMARIQRELK